MKLKIDLPCDPASSLPGVRPKEGQSTCQGDVCSPMWTLHSSQSFSLGVHCQMNKENMTYLCMCTKEYNSDILKKNLKKWSDLPLKNSAAGTRVGHKYGQHILKSGPDPPTGLTSLTQDMCC